MTVATRQIDHEAWSQSRYLAWPEVQPETLHFAFDGARPVAMAPATVGHNRIGRKICTAIAEKRPGGTPCDVYGHQDAIETVGGALREPDAFIACSRPPKNEVVVPAAVVVVEVLSPGHENRRRDEQERVDEYESVPTILRYVVVESDQRRYQVFWRQPGDRHWHRGTPEAATPIGIPELGNELSLDEVYAWIDFD
jgi:Uma2 family endonuclease